MGDLVPFPDLLSPQHHVGKINPIKDVTIRQTLSGMLGLGPDQPRLTLIPASTHSCTIIYRVPNPASFSWPLLRLAL